MSSAGTGWIKKLKPSSNGPGFQLYMILHHQQPATSPITSSVFPSLSLSRSVSWRRKSFYRNISLLSGLCVRCLWGSKGLKSNWPTPCLCVCGCVFERWCVRTNPQTTALKGLMLTRAKKRLFSVSCEASSCVHHSWIKKHSYVGCRTLLLQLIM